MNQALINYIKNPKNDELYTPSYAIPPLDPYISPGLTIWECTDFGGSEITKHFRNRGNKVITSHLNTNQSFFEYEPSDIYSVIVSNPPYSLKNEFLKRVFELQKAFAFLLPIATLETATRQKLFKENEIQLLIPDIRINYMKDKDQIYFGTCWFTYGLNLPKQLNFCEIDKPNKRKSKKID